MVFGLSSSELSPASDRLPSKIKYHRHDMGESGKYFINSLSSFLADQVLEARLPIQANERERTFFPPAEIFLKG